MPDPQMLVRPDFTISYANPACERLFGFDGGAIGLALQDLVGAASWEEVYPMWARFLVLGPHGSGTHGPVAIEGRRGTGERFGAEAVLVKIGICDAIRLVVVVREAAARRRHLIDSTARRLRVRSALELARLKDQFLSMMSHEIKTPLSVILGEAELLQERFPEERGLEAIGKSVLALSEKIQAILDYSALASGSLPLYRTEIGICEIASIAIDSVLDAFHSKGLSLRISVDRPAAIVLADQRRLVQAIVAVLDNARKFSPPSSQVRFRVSVAGNRVRFEIADAGPGMSRQEIEASADPFRQDRRRPPGDEGAGLGLGLPIVNRVMALHDGEVSIDSRLGSGTTVTLKLPAIAT
jgi:signal transduction histidine kinase